jgi:hypothetical protein
MFEQIKRICNNVKKLDSDKILKEIFDREDVKEEVQALQEAQMYVDGVDSKDKSLGNYSDVSVKVFGKPAGHIRVYDTGEFYDSIKIKSEKDQVVISANTIKTAWDGAVDLLDRWPALLGLNEKSLSKIRDYIKPLFIEEVRKAIFA